MVVECTIIAEIRLMLYLYIIQKNFKLFLFLLVFCNRFGKLSSIEEHAVILERVLKNNFFPKHFLRKYECF